MSRTLPWLFVVALLAAGCTGPDDGPAPSDEGTPPLPPAEPHPGLQSMWMSIEGIDGTGGAGGPDTFDVLAFTWGWATHDMSQAATLLDETPQQDWIDVTKAIDAATPALTGSLVTAATHDEAILAFEALGGSGSDLVTITFTGVQLVAQTIEGRPPPGDPDEPADLLDTLRLRFDHAEVALEDDDGRPDAEPTRPPPPIVRPPPAPAASRVAILSPEDGATLATDVPVSLQAAAGGRDDPCADVPDTAWTWTSDIQGTIARGRNASASLFDGKHRITVVVHDAQDCRGTDSVNVTVEAPEEPRAPPTVTIREPRAGAIMATGYTARTDTYWVDVDLAGSATDADGASLSGGQLAWSVDGEEVATGGTGTVRLDAADQCDVGEPYVVRLAATDAEGRTASETVRVTVEWPCPQ